MRSAHFVSPSLRLSVSCPTVSEYLTQLTWTGARQRYPNGIPEKVRRQIEHELVLICQLKIEPYFLTVFDLVRFARGRGILCQGRGSAANSAVCYCLGVTSVDPDRIDVLFERFVSAARDEPPDIDIDFEHERREEVIQYVYEKYGRDRAGMTAEVISYRGRSAVRDVGKALGLGLDAVDHIAKTLDWWHSGKLSAQQLAEAGLDPNDRTVRILVDLTHELLGFPRHLGQHVGGMVMTRGPLCELVPIENASMPDRTVIEWDKDDIDALGILKVDVLGLGMLTCISKSLKLLNAQKPSDIPLELHTLPPEDPAVYEMISDADTIGVFQIESRAQMSMLPRLRPEKFYDLVIEVAIVRPGPIQGDMVHPYLRRRRGEEVVEYPSEALRKVLEKTLGVPLFQEQAMKVAMVAAGFSAGEADQLRRAMAAWRHAGKIEQFHRKIIDGMLANGYTLEFAERCFNQIKGFAEYGFPESHAASFALLVYASSWIKRHHPAVFCCALLNSQPMGFYQPAQIVRDAREHGVEVQAIDVNFSDWDCTLEERDGRGTVPLRGRSPYAAGKANWGRSGPAVRLGLRQIKGMRQNHAEVIVQSRRRWGGFISVEQFQQATQLPRAAIERLAEADAFASLPQSRRMAIWQTMALSDEEFPLFGEGVGGQSPLRSIAGERDAETERRRDEVEEGHSITSSLRLSVSPSLHPLHASEPPRAEPATATIRMGDCPPSLPPMPLQQEVMTDYATAGLSLKRHPVSFVRGELTRRGIITAAQLARRQSGWVSVAGIVLIRQRPGTASGIVFVTLEDETGVANLIIRPDVFDRFSLAARKASLLQAEGRIQREGQVIHVMTYRLSDLTQLLSKQEFRSRDFR